MFAEVMSSTKIYLTQNVLTQEVSFSQNSKKINILKIKYINNS